MKPLLSDTQRDLKKASGSRGVRITELRPHDKASGRADQIASRSRGVRITEVSESRGFTVLTAFHLTLQPHQRKFNEHTCDFFMKSTKNTTTRLVFPFSLHQAIKTVSFDIGSGYRASFIFAPWTDSHTKTTIFTQKLLDYFQRVRVRVRVNTCRSHGVGVEE